MNKLLIFSFTLTLLLNGLLTKFFISKGLKAFEILILSGIGSLGFVLAHSIKHNHSLRPKNLKKQLLRALIAGTALFLVTTSYQYLSATSVSLVSRTDLAMLLGLGPLIHVPSTKRQRFLACLGVVLILVFIGINDDLQGMLLAFSGTVFITIGYLFIKVSMKEENESVSILTPSLSVLIYGVGVGAISDGAVFSSDPWLILSGLSLGALMFLLYRLTIKMYSVMDIASAEYPTLLASGLMLPFEGFFLGTHFSLGHIILVVTFMLLAGYGVQLFNQVMEA